ncbi:MAG: N-acetylmuramoyl-L-alanine amidase [Gemmatimonas sp.]|nr:N-acetylmuramoyl-L-alanine amidase [Gemmatimonas sp.]
MRSGKSLVGIRMIRIATFLAAGALTISFAGAACGQSGVPLVVIDAGHGGVDPGARGPSGTAEKTVALQIARQLAAALEADEAFDVRLTRVDDVLVPLSNRTVLANQWRDEAGETRPALFLSIHANAHRSSRVSGFETYFLSEANTQDARRVADFENSARRFEDTEPSDDSLGFILNDLRQNLYLHESSEGATLFQERLAGVHGGPNRGVKQAGFVVLDGAFMPAVLVELGFITNPEEEAMLRSPEQQSRLVGQLAAAVRDFFVRPSVRGIASEP